MSSSYLSSIAKRVTSPASICSDLSAWVGQNAVEAVWHYPGAKLCRWAEAHVHQRLTEYHAGAPELLQFAAVSPISIRFLQILNQLDVESTFSFQSQVSGAGLQGHIRYLAEIM
jgi:hypothetical protein